MIKIKNGPVQCTLSSDDVDEAVEVSALLDHQYRVFNPAAPFTPSYVNGEWDGYTHHFRPKTKTFDTGLLSLFYKFLVKHGYEVELEGFYEFDKHEFTEINFEGGVSLRPYQLEAVRKAVNFHRGVIRIATNGGKTEVAAGIIQILKVPKTIVLVPRKELMFQTQKRLQERLGISVGVLGANQTDTDHNVVVCMFQTLHRRLQGKVFKRWINQIELVIGDECHFSQASTYEKCITKIPSKYKIGMSGTPWPTSDRSAKLTVTGLFGPLLVDVTNKELMDSGVSVRPNIFMPVLRTRTVVASFYDYAYEQAVLKNPVRNRVIAGIAQGLVKSGRQTLIMVNTVEQGKILKRVMPWATFAHASSENRAEVRDRLDSGEPFCLIVTPIFDTGISTDHIEGMIFASGGRSQVQLLQRIGRGIRVSKEKDKSLWIFDFQDNHSKWTKSQSRDRLKEYKAQNAFNLVEAYIELPPEIQEFVDANDFR